MKRLFSRICGAALAAALVLSALPAVPARAAGIQVTLNDQPLSFSDAQPLMRDDRTFVPFRAIFETMGATVSWDDASRTVTAKRSDRTVKLTIGRKACTVDRAGADRSFLTDVAPFIEGGRTYVPIRFAAQALGAAVGWDSASQTVLLVDTEKMMQSEFAGQFQAITAMTQFANSVAPTSPRLISGAIGATLTYHTTMGDLPVPITGTITGSESLDAAQFTAAFHADRTAITQAIQDNEGMNVIDENVDALLQKLENFSADGILSRVDGKLYLKSDFLTEVGIAKGQWAMKDLDSTASLTAVKDGDATDFICAQAQKLTLRPGTSTSQVREVVRRLSDQSASSPLNGTGSYSLHWTADNYTAVDMTLVPGQSLTVMRTASPLGADAVPMTTLTTVQTKNGASISYERSASSYNAAIRIDLNNGGAATTAPAVRPS